MKNLTLFIIASGEESLNDCEKAIKAQKLSSEIELIVKKISNVTPMSEAFNEMHRQSSSPFFIQVDADMILNENAVQTLYDGIKNSFFWTYAAYGQLYEEGFGVGGSIRIWRRSFFKLFEFKDARTVDRNLFKRAKRWGFRRKNLKKVLGVHRPRHSSFSEYLKTKSDIEKWRFLKRPASRYAIPLLSDFLDQPEANKTKLFGAILGTLTPWQRVLKSKDSKYEKRFLEMILSFFETQSIDEITLNIPKKDKFFELYTNAYEEKELSKESQLLFNMVFQKEIKKEFIHDQVESEFTQ